MARHALSVDVEDWYQSVYDANSAITSRFEANVDKVLALFATRNVKATFFVLGLAAQKSPAVVKAIQAAGHEIQSHGFGHIEVFHLTPEQFYEDLVRSRKLLEDIAGTAVIGYRAPRFSIDHRAPWALDVLVKAGYRYDSSIFPIKMPRYGIDHYPPEPRVIEAPGGGRLVEVPVACFDWLGKRRPIGGGGYFRLFPYWVLRKAWRQLEAQGRPGVVYMHPYEFDPEEMNVYKDSVPWKRRLQQGLGRKRFPRKVERLIGEFEFGTIGELIAGLAKSP